MGALYVLPFYYSLYDSSTTKREDKRTHFNHSKIMPGLSFLSKKSWHTSNLCNQEKVWIAEQKAESEARKCAELREQIKVEREREEFDRLTKGDAVGDRGTNWMYEGGGAAAAAASGIGGGGGASAAREEEEARRNEAYLLGKEYAPEGGARQSGDFAEASTMTGALEKASTHGATIGAGYAADNGGGSTRLRIQEDAATTSSAAAAAADGGDGAKINNDERDGDWSQNFHLRHEDPMFAVHQRRQAQLKDAEKKKRLLERAGLDVSVVARRDPVGGNDEDGEYRKGDASEGGGDDYDAGRRERKRKRRSKSEKKKKRSTREEEHRRHRHSKSKRDKHKRRNNNRDDDDRSSSSSPSYSSSSASVSSGRNRRHRDGRKGQRVHSTEYDRRRRRRRAEEDDYDDRSRSRDISGRRGERRRSRSGSRRKMARGEDNDHHRDRRTVRDCDEKDGRRRPDGYGDSRNRDDEEGRGGREQSSSSAPSPSGTFNDDYKTGMAIGGGGATASSARRCPTTPITTGRRHGINRVGGIVATTT